MAISYEEFEEIYRAFCDASISFLEGKLDGMVNSQDLANLRVELTNTEAMRVILDAMMQSGLRDDVPIQIVTKELGYVAKLIKRVRGVLPVPRLKALCSMGSEAIGSLDDVLGLQSKGLTVLRELYGFAGHIADFKGAGTKRK